MGDEIARLPLIFDLVLFFPLYMVHMVSLNFCLFFYFCSLVLIFHKFGHCIILVWRIRSYASKIFGKWKNDRKIFKKPKRFSIFLWF